ncbi:fimbrial protein [Erwinia psidii]|uniref:Type 1 fimbrial protein n=1 Tax=Erwinia psidii TaxID=69224 RepID=A0A3N6SCI0_9GAMM|nr:fimbrial protein [Erwinia psidii]MCX8955830.1 type 1 fimbrial protein [Erwinia psidii]MCX8961613.1 type 1 fimbrial protein [Erwinia psidii]MCX8965713.1 type 1 fimbrial protein [Erwinia psidii]RQM37663.1 type 1 fimbrial protein [Erwinia psidii]
MKKKLAFTFFVLSVFCYSGSALATGYCTSAVDAHTIELGTIYVPVQSTTGDIVSMSQRDIQVTCDADVSTYLQPGDPDFVWGSTGETFMTPEGISCAIVDSGFALEGTGLGLVWIQRNSGSNGWSCLSGALIGAGKVRRGLVRRGLTTLTDKFYVVRTSLPLVYKNAGNITQSIGVDEADENRVAIGQLYTIYISGNVIIESGGCTIESNPVVSMGTVSTSTFRGIGTRGANVPFYIDLQKCYGVEKKIDIAFQPVSGFLDEANSVIALEEGSNAASGVGIQLMFNGENIHTDGSYHSFPLQQGLTRLPFVARYYQVANTVTPGTVESSVIFYVYYE